MRDTMHQIDSGVIISFLNAILRKFRECVELPLGIAGAAAAKLTARLRKLLGKEKIASGHIMHGAHACLVPVNFHTSNVFRQLLDKQKAARNTRSCDYRHLLLLLPFILSNLFREEVNDYNRSNRGHPVLVVDPSGELIGVTNVFLRWYKLFRKTTPGKTPSDIGTLQSLSTRYVLLLLSTINPGTITSVDSSSTTGMVRNVATRRSRRFSYGLQYLSHCAFTSAIPLKISNPRRSFFAMPSCALLYIKTRSAIATGDLSLPPLQKKDKGSENGVWDTKIYFSD